MSLSLDLDIEVLDIRDQSEKFAWTDQYPGIEILMSIWWWVRMEQERPMCLK